MNISLLKDSFSKIDQQKLDAAVANINGYRSYIGNGVAVGKLAEPIIAGLLNQPPTGLHCFPFVFTGVNPPFDLLLYEAPKPLPVAAFFNERASYRKDPHLFAEKVDTLVGSNDWCGISLKNYINEEAQISTNYQIRTWLEDELGTAETSHTNPALIQRVKTELCETLSHEVLLFLNSFPSTQSYQLSTIDLNGTLFDEIVYHKLKKHARYTFRLNGKPVFHSKYGKNQANPFQRGLWVDDICALTTLGKGKYSQSSFGDYIMNGAYVIH